MLPFMPEPVARLRQRYTKALEKIWIAEEDMDDTPGQHREHVFDFSNGLRLLISRDIFDQARGPEIHVSASYFKNEELTLEESNDMIATCFRLLDNKQGQRLHLVGVSEKGVPHFIVKGVN